MLYDIVLGDGEIFSSGSCRNEVERIVWTIDDKVVVDDLVFLELA